MTTVQKTANKLKLRFFPWYSWVMTVVVSVMCSPIYLTTFSQTVPVKTLSCQRSQSKQINCRSQDFTFLPFRPQTVLIEDLQAVRLNRISDNNQFQKQEVLLLTKQEKIVFLSKNIDISESTEFGVSYIESQINSFINNTNQQVFEFHTGNSEFQWFLLFGFIIFLVFLGYFCETSICEFDSSTGLMTKKRKWFFLITKTSKFPLADIEFITLQHTRIKMQNYYRVTLSLVSGQQIPLSTFYTNSFKSQEKVEAEADLVANFLSMPRM